MPKLGQIQKDLETKDVTITFEDGVTLGLKVLMGKFTVGWQRKAKEIGDDISGIADHFFSAVKDWDLEDDNGKKLPLDQSSIDMLGIGTLFSIMSLMTEQLSPKEETSND